jgi:uncharacterized membrane protein YgdD (TMEM256/DUF423 family)
MPRIWMMLSGMLGFLAVAFGAFGAHALRDRLAASADGALRLTWWQTGANYHLVHALALGLVALWGMRSGPSTALNVAGAAFAVGALLFSGSLYAMTLTGMRGLGAITPLGGLCFLVGWAALGIAGWRVGGLE